MLVLIGVACGALAQPANSNCSGALTLCAQQPLAGNNTGANGALPTLCPPGGNLLWYSFTTNSVGGAVDVTINGINCSTTPGMDNELSVVVLSGNGSCTPGSFTVVGPCRSDSVDFILHATFLAPNTQYWVVVAGMMNNGATLTANCGFNISTSGPGADIIGVDFSAGPDVIIAQGQNTQLNATGGTTYDWMPTSGLSSNTIANPIAQPTESTTYSVTTQINGCTYTDMVFVDVRRLIDAANTITPNGDGHNDTWEIAGINGYPQADVSIYDRWGQRVFHSIGYKTPFDGTNGGSKLPTATYYWVIELNRVEGTSVPYKGFITIVN